VTEGVHVGVGLKDRVGILETLPCVSGVDVLGGPASTHADNDKVVKYKMNNKIETLIIRTSSVVLYRYQGRRYPSNWNSRIRTMITLLC